MLKDFSNVVFIFFPTEKEGLYLTDFILIALYLLGYLFIF